jgi:hypothetical protein
MIKNWKDVKISYGSAEMIPGILKLLCSQDNEEREKSYWQIQNAVVLQSDLYEGAYFIVEPLLEILENDNCSNKFAPLDILFEIFNGYAPFDNMIINEEGLIIHLAEACRNKIRNNRHRIERIVVKLEQEQKAKADLLDIIDNPPPLFPSEEELRQLMAELERLRNRNV